MNLHPRSVPFGRSGKLWLMETAFSASIVWGLGFKSDAIRWQKGPPSKWPLLFRGTHNPVSSPIAVMILSQYMLVTLSNATRKFEYPDSRDRRISRRVPNIELWGAQMAHNSPNFPPSGNGYRGRENSEEDRRWSARMC